MVQIIDNFDHRSNKPNFVRDQFDTLQAMRSFPSTDVDDGHISYCKETDKHYKFKANNAIDEETGKWREFKGEKGDKGEPGQGGQNATSNLTAFVFRSNETEPTRPSGGSWNVATNVFTPPIGWYTTEEDLVGTIWMSWGIFTTEGTIKDSWADPIRLTGADGQNGKDGKDVEFIYKTSNRAPSELDRPSSVDEDDHVPSGWTDSPTGISSQIPYEWMCVRTKNKDVWSDWNGPTIWSKWGSDGRDGDGLEFIFKKTVTGVAPDRPTIVTQVDGYVPEGWTDNPIGVDASSMYEWVSQRKYKNDEWGEFSEPALWAKWGEKGDPGRDGADGTSINIKGQLESVSDLPLSGQPGDAYVINSDLYVWDGIRWNNIGGIKGPAGDSAYVHIAFADGVATDSYGNVTAVYGFSTTGSVNKAYIGTCADHNVADPTDPLVYKWQKNKGEKGDAGPQGVPGEKGENGTTLYTWIKYADDIKGSGMSNDPTGKEYIGLAYNKPTPVESDTASDYTWSKITGGSGVPGPPGEDGKTLYTWIKYADVIPTSDTSIIYDIPNANTKYIGIAVNKETATESTNGMLYTWSLFRGEDGTDGKNGRIIYPAGIYDATVTYTATDIKAPYIIHGDNYYVMNKTTSWLGSSTGKTPQQDYEDNGLLATWIPMEKFNAIYTNILISDYGKLGKFVFYGDYMFSQEGVDRLGNSSSEYQKFQNSEIPVKFTDTSIFSTVNIGGNLTGTVTDSKITITAKKTGALNTQNIFTSNVVTPKFYVTVTGLQYYEGQVSISYKYYVNTAGSNGSITLENGINELPRSMGDQYLTTTMSITIDASISTDYPITIEIVPDDFTPNFQVNALTGEVHMNKGFIKAVVTPDTKSVFLTKSSAAENILVDESWFNKTVYIYSKQNDYPEDNSLVTAVVSPALYNDVVQDTAPGTIFGSIKIVNITNTILKLTTVVSRYFPVFAGTAFSNLSTGPSQEGEIRLYPGGTLELDVISLNGIRYSIIDTYHSFFFQIRNASEFAYNSTDGYMFNKFMMNGV